MNQVRLIGAIAKHLESQGVKDMNVRQMNAIIAAADAIIAAFAKNHRPAVPEMGLEAWLDCDETGRSSLYLAWMLAEASGTPYQGMRSKPRISWPLDPSDFARCVVLLDAVPVFREHLDVMTSGHGPQWAALAANWEELEALYREEFPTGKAPKLYARMTALTKEEK